MTDALLKKHLVPQRNGSDSLLFFSVPTSERVPQDEVEKLLIELGDGNTDALERLYIKTKAAVYGFALSILKNPHQAEDVLQDTYLKIFSAASSYTPKGKPMAWIMTVTKNLALMKIRERDRFSDLPEHYEPSVESHEVHFENKSVLNAALNILSGEESSIVIMHAVSGMKHREIAEVMNLSLSTVLSKYNRALKKMKSALEGVF